MSFLSRFFKPQPDDDDPLAGLEESSEGEGLFIGDESRKGDPGPNEPLPARPRAAQDEEQMSEANADPWPEEDAADDGEAGEEPQALEEPEHAPHDQQETNAETEPPPEEPQAERPADDDDPLAMFRDSARDLGVTELTKDLEDVPVQEVLSDLREVRDMLADPAKRTNGHEEAA